MQIHEIITLTVKRGSLRNPALLSKALAAISAFNGQTTLLGSWVPEFGPQNRILLLRSFNSLDELYQERLRVLGASDPFVPAEMLVSMECESFVPFPGQPPVRAGAYGPYYEFRTYLLRTGGLAPTVAAWSEGVPRRVALSPLVAVMHSLDGPPRFIHIWGYRDLGERERIRARAFEIGAWPAPGAPEWLTETQKSELYMPTGLSKLT